MLNFESNINNIKITYLPVRYLFSTKKSSKYNNSAFYLLLMDS